MKWNEVRNDFPNKFILFEVIESKNLGDKELVEDIKVIDTFDNGTDARKAFIKKKPNQYVYSTNNEKIEIEVLKYVGVRRTI